MRAWRIGKPPPPHPLFDATGALIHGGRWNSPGRGVIYAASTFSLAVLEILAHAQIGILPPRLRVVEIHVPDHVALETVEAASLPGWDADDYAASRDYGDRWLAEARTAVLLVPSVLSPVEPNVVINPRHPGATSITASEEGPLSLDARLQALFGRPTAC